MNRRKFKIANTLGAIANRIVISNYSLYVKYSLELELLFCDIWIKWNFSSAKFFLSSKLAVINTMPADILEISRVAESSKFSPKNWSNNINKIFLARSYEFSALLIPLRNSYKFDNKVNEVVEVARPRWIFWSELKINLHLPLRIVKLRERERERERSKNSSLVSSVHRARNRPDFQRFFQSRD